MADSKELVTKYFNTIAVIVSDFSTCPKSIKDLKTRSIYEEAMSDTIKALDKLWNENDKFNFLKKLTSFIKDCKTDNENYYITLLIICGWLDSRITYEDINSNNHLSVYALIPLVDDPIELLSLNNNCDETRIQIIPRYSIIQKYDEDRKTAIDVENPFANGDLFKGINRFLTKISVVAIRENVLIKNIVIPPKLYDKGVRNISVAFCPMTDSNDNLIVERKQVFEHGEMHNVESMKNVKNPNELYERFVQDWTLAAFDAKVDIAFWPELLGSEEIEESFGTNPEYNKKIMELSKAVLAKGGDPPLLTILPGLSKNGINSVTIVYRNGQVIARQLKYKPFIYETERLKEYLRYQEKRTYYVIHIPNVHRLTVLLLADYDDYIDIAIKDSIGLFSEAGISLTIIPTYSKGENSFGDTLANKNCFGPTVIWGDCCGASRRSKTICGSYVSGIDTAYRIDKCSQLKCDGKCKNTKSCMFVTQLPLSIEKREKSSPTLLKENLIQHCLQYNS